MSFQTWLSLWQFNLKLTFPFSGEILGTLSSLHSFFDKLSIVITAFPT